MLKKSLLAVSAVSEKYPKPPAGYGTARITIGKWDSYGDTECGFNFSFGGAMQYFGAWSESQRYTTVKTALSFGVYYAEITTESWVSGDDFYVDGVHYLVNRDMAGYDEAKITALFHDWEKSVGQTRFLWLPLL